MSLEKKIKTSSGKNEKAFGKNISFDQLLYVVLYEKYLQIIISFFITTDYEDIAKIGKTFPDEIIDKIFEYERYILMTEHLPMFKYVLKDIEEGLKIILIDPDWHKQYVREINDVFHLQFPWKRDDWVQQPLEKAALYIGEGRIVCSKQVPSVENPLYVCHHPYYWTKYSDLVYATPQEIKLINH